METHQIATEKVEWDLYQNVVSSSESKLETTYVKWRALQASPKE